MAVGFETRCVQSLTFWRARLAPDDSSLITAEVLISFARFANFSVDSVSAMLFSLGDAVAIKRVFELPPKESLRRKVNLLSRYCMCLRWDVPLTTFDARALITFPRADRDLLICPASFSLSPVQLVSLCLSLPARSTRENFADRQDRTPVSAMSSNLHTHITSSRVVFI